MDAFLKRHHDMYAVLKDCGFNSPEQNMKTIKIMSGLVQKRIAAVQSKENQNKPK